MTEIAKQLIAYLDCPCQVFAPMNDDDPILDAYREACEEGKAAGFTPVLLPADEMLLETFCGHVGLSGELDVAMIRAWRETLLAEEIDDGADFLQESLDLRRHEIEEEGFDWEELMGEVADGEVVEGLSAYWNQETEWTDEVILAKIPVAEPWKVFAWLPMGGWNECPAPQQMMAAAKHWYKNHGAVPAAISHGVLEFVLPAAVSDEAEAEKLALEHYGFCIDRVEQCSENGTVGELTDSLMNSKVWFFWWE